MALRLDIQVVRGEIDSRVRGKVRGRVWLAGHPEPLRLELDGNPWRDLAGCRLEFENPKPQVVRGMPEIHADQAGITGDITASRKVRVPDVPIEEFYEQCKAGIKPPEHWGNCLYLEWFSRTNGRVVIESADYVLKVSLPEWQMTEAEEYAQKTANEQAMTDFLARLTEVIKKDRKASRDGNNDGMDEFAWEKTLRSSDVVGEKYSELIDKYGHGPEADEIIHRKMGWHHNEDELTPEQKAWREELTAIEMEAMASLENEEAGEEWKRGTDGGDKENEGEGDDDGLFSERHNHPLVQRAGDAAMVLWKWSHDHGLMDGDTADEDVCEMTFQGQRLGAKLAGALNGIKNDLPMMDGFVVAALKRALPILDAALAATLRVGEKTPLPLPADMLAANRDELFAIREEMLRLMDEFRRKK